jgi:3-oxoacyl-[acyl-carrier protein] reductase
MSNGNRSRIALAVDHAALEAFAAFSGDRSPLHLDPEYGRRSRFGGNVAHGMLPLMALPALLEAEQPGQAWRIVGAEVRFLQPILPGERVVLTGSVAATNEGAVLPFAVLRGPQEAEATRGSLVLEPAEAVHAHAAATPTSAPLTEGVALNDHRFESLEAGMATELAFAWGAGQLAGYEALLKRLIGSARMPATSDGTALAMACLALASTQVGMLMPGRTATFQEARFAFGEAVQQGTRGSVRSSLVSLSSAAGTLSQSVRIGLNDAPFAEGKLIAQVARSPFVPPSMAELAARGTGLGLEGKVVLITGSGRGLGATTAKLFAVHGARVAVNYRSAREQAEAVAADIRAHGGEAMALQADVTDADAVRAMVEAISSAWGPVDVLVNNAAGNFHPAPFDELRWEQMQGELDVVLKGAFHAVQAVLPGFKAKGGGRIINVSTIAVDAPPRLQARYVVAKTALNGLTRALAVELADRNILVNLVAPSFLETDFTSGTNRVTVGQLKAASPLKRLAEPHEAAEAIVFLASNRSTYTSGQRMLLTGGGAPYL